VFQAGIMNNPFFEEPAPGDVTRPVHRVPEGIKKETPTGKKEVSEHALILDDVEGREFHLARFLHQPLDLDTMKPPLRMQRLRPFETDDGDVLIDETMEEEAQEVYVLRSKSSFFVTLACTLTTPVVAARSVPLFVPATVCAHS
jgi:hypothetical protein